MNKLHSKLLRIFPIYITFLFTSLLPTINHRDKHFPYENSFAAKFVLYDKLYSEYMHSISITLLKEAFKAISTSMKNVGNYAENIKSFT